MNKRQLEQLGIKDVEAQDAAVAAIRNLVSTGRLRTLDLADTLSRITDNPQDYVNDTELGEYAQTLIKIANYRDPDPIEYRSWCPDVEQGAKDQIKNACAVPGAVKAALMPDAHQGYGLPIGGVLAVDDAIIPYAVGVDIACRMKLSILDIAINKLLDDNEHDTFVDAIEKNTIFGCGKGYARSGRNRHKVMDDPRWNDVEILKQKKDTAWEQLGTSGSGNHFINLGITHFDENNDLGLEAGDYVTILTHSGSRGAGANVCKTYSKIAMDNLHDRYKDRFKHLAWLDMKSEAGQEYWTAMNLMGDYAAANHDCIHKRVAKHLGAEILAGVENHHNFAWREKIDGRDVYVHRKGATPAFEGQLGVIPGSMGTATYIVRGKGNVDSVCSASHGAGRLMSRRQGKDTFDFQTERKRLADAGIKIISAGADEVPGVYKDIETVMQAQTDLVDIVAKFEPKIVKMCGDGSKPED